MTTTTKCQKLVSRKNAAEKAIYILVANCQLPTAIELWCRVEQSRAHQSEALASIKMVI